MNYYCFLVIITSILTFKQCAESANILGVFPLAGKSVNILYNRLFKGLADAGHNVTIISAFGNTLPILNGSYTDVHLTGFVEAYDSLVDHMNLLETPEENSISQIKEIFEALFSSWNDTLNHPHVKKLLASDAKFDLMITEYFWSESLLVFSKIYSCPVVLFTSIGGINPWVNDMVGNPMPPSYVPHFFLLGDYSRGMNFCDRTHNLFFYLYDFIFKHYISFPAHNKLLKRNFQDPPDVATLYSNVSLVLLGSHSSLRQATPLVPNVVEIGGFHIDPPKKLPKDLQEFLDSAKDGAIYFSMGSHIKSTHFSEEKKQIMINAFKKLKLKVVWKFEEELPGKPENLLIRKWLPQMDILAHQNIKLFISHGGYGSTLETIYHGVPALFIPVFADQYNNANQAVTQGYALKISYSDKNFNEETIFTMIKEMLENPKYTENAKLKSRLFHDRPLKPLDTAIYWIEYIIRHKGADHLKVAGRNLPWYQFYMIDVISVLLLSVLTVFYCIYFCLKYIYRALGKFVNVKVKRS